MNAEDAQAAKDELEKAIQKYYYTMDPDAFIQAYALVVHKESVELHQENSSAVGVLTPTGQSFPMSTGILLIGLDIVKAI